MMWSHSLAELDGNTVLPKSPSDQGNNNNSDKASGANSVNTFFHEELNEEVVPIVHAQGDLGRSIAATDSNLSNFSENVIHDMQVEYCSLPKSFCSFPSK